MRRERWGFAQQQFNFYPLPDQRQKKTPLIGEQQNKRSVGRKQIIRDLQGWFLLFNFGGAPWGGTTLHDKLCRWWWSCFFVFFGRFCRWWGGSGLLRPTAESFLDLRAVGDRGSSHQFITHRVPCWKKGSIIPNEVFWGFVFSHGESTKR